ncbi:MAG TPA: hypothetical protein VJV23_10510 [Candidatus Polarisedimenticolia bacterium]|nr:hypothetical protein [Candidatus Polarisedimenticolia bacterium]
MSAADRQTQATARTTGDPLTEGKSWLRRGALLLPVGLTAMAVMLTLIRLLRPPLLLASPVMLLAAYPIIVGGEGLLRGAAAAWGSSLPAARRLRRLAGAAAVVSLLAPAAVLGALWEKAGVFERGDRATDRLQHIAERHVARLQQGAEGTGAVSVWRESSSQGLSLRQDLEAAGSLARARLRFLGSVSARAREDAAFYDLCAEWMDLYARVQSTLDQTSLAEPPEDWGETQNSIVERIQSLTQAGQER